MKEHTKSLGNDMPKIVKCVYYAITLFGNVVINKIPSRHIRKWFYQLMGAEIGKIHFHLEESRFYYQRGLSLQMVLQ